MGECDGHCSGNWTDPHCSRHGTPARRHAPDVDYLRGVNDALAEVNRRFVVYCKITDDQPIPPASAFEMLRRAAAELGVET